MSNRFVSLATLLLAPPQTPETPHVESVLAEQPAANAVLVECALFRARLREAFDQARAALLADLAAEVLARELQLAPAAIDAIVQRLLDACADETPVTLRVSPPDRDDIAVDLPVEIDPSLRAGDAVVVVRNGTIESTLGVRLEAVVRAAQSR